MAKILREGNAELSKIDLKMVPSSVGGATEPDVDIRELCREKWRTDFEMQDYCMKQQEEARDQVKSRNIDDAIAHFCAGRWSGDWEMFAYCVKKQSEAKARLD